MYVKGKSKIENETENQSLQQLPVGHKMRENEHVVTKHRTSQSGQPSTLYLEFRQV